MGGLKPETTDLSSTEDVKPKRRGNPSLQKGKRNPYYESKLKEQKPMADEATETVNNSSEVSGEKKAIPVDEFSDVIPDKDFIPLEGEPRSKDYGAITDSTQPKVDGNGNINNPPPPPGANPNPVTDPNMNPMGGPPVPSEETRTKAEQAVKMALNLYEKLHGVGRHLGKMSDADQNSMHMAGKINLHHNLPLGKGATTVGGFIKQINDEIDEHIVVEQKFKDEITPPLTRIAIKNNWGLSDEWFVGALLLEDVTTKASVLFSMKHTLNLVLESCIRTEKAAAEAKNPKNKPEKKAEETVSNNTSNEDPNVKDVSWEDMKDVPSQ